MTKANGRRLNGEGGKIRKVSNRNLFKSQIRVNVHGKPKRVDVYGKTRKEVLGKIKEAKRLADSGIAPTEKETVAQYLIGWHDKDATLRPKTIHSRMVNINRMTPHIGSLKLTELKADHIETMYKRLGEQFSDRSLVQVNAVLRKAMKDAVKGGSIVYSPIDRVLKQPTAKQTPFETLSLVEVKTLLAINDEWTPLFTLLLGTGLRIGEALGLAWTSIDLEQGELSVTRSLQFVSGLGFIFNDPKTDASRSEIPLSPAVISALKTHQARQAEQRLALGPNWKYQGLVFPNSWGKPMFDSTATRALHRSLKEACIDKHIRIHDLRHTAATLLVEKGVHTKDVQDMLRHANYATTMDIYVHNNRETLREAANILGDAITG